MKVIKGGRPPERGTRSVRGITLVEVLVSVAILGLAISPVVGILSNSFRQIREEKMEATAAVYADKLMNRILYELSFDQVTGGGGAIDPPNPLQGNTEVDGTSLRWETTVDPTPGLRLKFKKVKYHAPCPLPGVESKTIEYLPKPGTGGANFDFNEEPKDVDTKFQTMGTPGFVGKVLVDVKLMIRWKRREDAAFAPNENKVLLFTRKARLE